MTRENTSHWDILELQPGATPDQIKAAFRKKAKKFHPDHGGDEEKFIELCRAVETLLSPTDFETITIGTRFFLNNDLALFVVSTEKTGPDTRLRLSPKNPRRLNNSAP